MRIRIRDRSQLGRLVEYLEARDCRIGFRDGDLDVRPRHLHAEARGSDPVELWSSVDAWAASNPDAGVECVPETPRSRRPVR